MAPYDLRELAQFAQALNLSTARAQALATGDSATDPTEVEIAAALRDGYLAGIGAEEGAA